MTQIQDSTSGTITRGYDGLDRPVLEMTAQGSVGYPYDAADFGSMLTLYTVPPDLAGSTTIGGTPASLTTLVPGQTATVAFATTVTGQTAAIAVTADTRYSSACYNVTVSAPGGAVVNSGEGCGTAYSTGALPLAASGTYTITIASASTAVGNVSVGVTAQ